MMWLKSCPRCDRGDLKEDKDMYGQYVHCLQCGHMLSEEEDVSLRYQFPQGRATQTNSAARRVGVTYNDEEA